MICIPYINERRCPRLAIYTHTYDYRWMNKANSYIPRNLITLGKPNTPNLTPDSSEVTEGSSLTLTCTLTSTSQPLAYRPTMTYSWEEDGQVKSNEKSSSLEINSVSKGHSVKRYRCRGQEVNSILTSDYNNEVELTFICKCRSRPISVCSIMFNDSSRFNLLMSNNS